MELIETSEEKAVSEEINESERGVRVSGCENCMYKKRKKAKKKK